MPYAVTRFLNRPRLIALAVLAAMALAPGASQAAAAGASAKSCAAAKGDKSRSNSQSKSKNDSRPARSRAKHSGSSRPRAARSRAGRRGDTRHHRGPGRRRPAVRSGAGRRPGHRLPQRHRHRPFRHRSPDRHRRHAPRRHRPLRRHRQHGPRRTFRGHREDRGARHHDWRKSYRRHKRDQRLHTLPKGHRKLRVRRKSYYYHDGAFYEPFGGAFIVVSAPIGAHIATLPYGCASFWIGPTRYYFLDDTYYTYDAAAGDYVVVAEPDGADEAMGAAQSILDDLAIYPNRGQSPQRQERDLAECYNWAVREAGFDPDRSAYYSNAQRDFFIRALTACMEARGYTVR